MSGNLEVDRTTFSAPTARIVMGGDLIGALQDLNWTENYNIVRVKGFGSRTDIAQVDGFTEYEITARRAFIDGDMVFTLFQPIDIVKLSENYGVDGTSLPGTNVYTVDKDLSKTKLSILETALTEGVQAVSLVFDIEVQNNFGDVMFTFNKCKLNIRRASLTTGAIILTEDVTILSRYKTFPSAQLAQEIANIALSKPASQA